MRFSVKARHLPPRVPPQGIPLAKDAWMMGIGLGLVIDDLTDRLGPKD